MCVFPMYMSTVLMSLMNFVTNIRFFLQFAVTSICMLYLLSGDCTTSHPISTKYCASTEANVREVPSPYQTQCSKKQNNA